MDYQTLVPLMGAEVQLSGTQMVAVTDTDGNYELLSVTPGNYKLEVTYLGLSCLLETLSLKKGRS